MSVGNSAFAIAFEPLFCILLAKYQATQNSDQASLKANSKLITEK
jgi:hypothetical protein